MKKILCYGLSLIVMLSVLAGCSSSGGSGNGSAPAAEGSASKSQSSAVAAGDSAITLTGMWNGTETDAEVKYYKEFVNDFNATNEFGATFDMQFYENEQYKTKLATLMASNSVPDVFFTWELDYLRPFVEGGKVLDITDMLEADQELKANFQDGVLEPLKYSDRLFALPTQNSFTVMFYNKQIFEENKVTAPTTWDEFLSVCQTLKDNGVVPLCITAPDAWMPSQFIQQIANGINGLEWYENLLDGTGKWNNDAFVQAGTVAHEVINKGYLQDGFLGMATEEGQKMMSEGKCAMYFMGSWDVGRYGADGSQIQDVVSAFSLPAINPANNNIPVGSVDSSLAIASSSKHPEAAFAFVKHWLSDKNQETLLYEAGRIPCTKIDVDMSRVSPLMADVLAINNQLAGLSPWLDRAFGAGEGVEYNNACQAIFGGEDSQKAFDALQRYVEDNADN